MSDKNNTEQREKKSFFGKMIEKIDKKLEEKSQKTPCCSPKDKGKGSSCC
ncbi:MAG: hypothetical protein KC733_04700 [Candidatus Omnitrophica bacterium]|nr:hypothetical protein [Candidatus Omnitrophota bacterium]